MTPSARSIRPDAICPNCWAVWRAGKPRTLSVRCWHQGAVARPKADGWQIVENVGDLTLRRLRAEGEL